MTRINVIPVKSLCRQHLVAEYRELPRVFALAHKASQSNKPWTNKQPKSYTLGTGHVLFFYDKLGYLAERHKELVEEMLHRGYSPSFTGCLRQEWEDRIPKGYWKAYTPDKEALEVNQQRINERLRGDEMSKFEQLLESVLDDQSSVTLNEHCGWQTNALQRAINRLDESTSLLLERDKIMLDALKEIELLGGKLYMHSEIARNALKQIGEEDHYVQPK